MGPYKICHRVVWARLIGALFISNHLLLEAK